jgi:hypothetical protein
MQNTTKFSTVDGDFIEFLMKFDATFHQNFQRSKFCNILMMQNVVICFFFVLIFASYGER